MEKLDKTNARFCAKYVKFVGVAYTKRGNCGIGMVVDGIKFGFDYSSSRDFQVGEKVYIAKRIPTQRHEDQKWEIHQIELPEVYWNYEYFMTRPNKQQRAFPYTPMAQTWFGSNTRIVKKIK